MQSKYLLIHKIKTLDKQDDYHSHNFIFINKNIYEPFLKTLEEIIQVKPTNLENGIYYKTYLVIYEISNIEYDKLEVNTIYNFYNTLNKSQFTDNNFTKCFIINKEQDINLLLN